MIPHLTDALATDAEIAERVRAAERELNAAIDAAAGSGVSVMLGIASQMADDRRQRSYRVRVTRIERPYDWIAGRAAVKL